MKRTLTSPLARWGFTILAILAAYVPSPGAFLITAGLAFYGWRERP